MVLLGLVQFANHTRVLAISEVGVGGVGGEYDRCTYEPFGRVWSLAIQSDAPPFNEIGDVVAIRREEFVEQPSRIVELSEGAARAGKPEAHLGVRGIPLVQNLEVRSGLGRGFEDERVL